MKTLAGHPLETTTINEIIRRFPATVAVFHAFGMDACCGGDLPVFEAARRHGVDQAALADALARAADPEA